MRPPCRRARSTRSKLSSSAPQTQHHDWRPWARAGSAKLAQQCRRSAFDDDVGVLHQSRAKGSTGTGRAKSAIAASARADVARRDRGKRQPLDAAVEMLRDNSADRAKAGDGDALRHIPPLGDTYCGTPSTM